MKRHLYTALTHGPLFIVALLIVAAGLLDRGPLKDAGLPLLVLVVLAGYGTGMLLATAAEHIHARIRPSKRAVWLRIEADEIALALEQLSEHTRDGATPQTVLSALAESDPGKSLTTLIEELRDRSDDDTALHLNRALRALAATQNHLAAATRPQT